MGLKFNRASNGTRHKEGVRRRFTRANVARESNKGGVYHFYDENGRRIYTGVSKGNFGAQWGDQTHQRYRYGMRHRLQAKLQRDDFQEHPTKRALRPQIHSYRVNYESDPRRRSMLEKKYKNGNRHNHL